MRSARGVVLRRRGIGSFDRISSHLISRVDLPRDSIPYGIGIASKFLRAVTTASRMPIRCWRTGPIGYWIVTIFTIRKPSSAQIPAFDRGRRGLSGGGGDAFLPPLDVCDIGREDCTQALGRPHFRAASEFD